MCVDQNDSMFLQLLRQTQKENFPVPPGAIGREQIFRKLII